jgi:gas vesicle protein
LVRAVGAFATSLAPTHIVTVAGGRVRLTPTSGAFSEAGWDAAVTAALDAAAGAAAVAGAAAAPAPAPAAAPAGGFEDRQKTKKSRQRLDKCMSLIEAAEKEIGELDTTIAAAFEKGDGPAAAKASARQEKLQADIERLFEEAEQLETELAGASAS